MRRLTLPLCALLLAACAEHGCTALTVTQGKVPRCELPLEPFGVQGGTGAQILAMTSPAQGIGGPTAQGKAGDFLLSNDKIRVVVQGEDRHIAVQPYGGTIIDADLVRPGPGQDQFGEIGLLYNFGRTVDATTFEILRDGRQGGAVVLAASGRDTENDFLSIRNQLKNSLGSVPAADPHVKLPLRITNYFILRPGEHRVHYVTAFCNEGDREVALAVGDLTDAGYTVEFFNGQSCTDGFGFGGPCFGIDRMSWYGYQGNDVAYGYAPYRPNAPDHPERQNAMLTLSGVTGTILGTPGLTGLLEWFDPGVTSRRGELKIPPFGKKHFARDFVVARDLGQLTTLIEESRSEALGERLGELSGTVTSGGRPLAGARVSVRSDTGYATTYVTDASGQYRGRLPAKRYGLAAWAPGRPPSDEVMVSVPPEGAASASFTLIQPRRLTVSVRDTVGRPIPAKVTLLCASGTCPVPSASLNRFTDRVRDLTDSSIELIDFVPPSGSATFEVSPGRYRMLVSRGPEYSIYPNDYPANPGILVDLTTADVSHSAILARVLDTIGHMSADYHVHAVNSPDSPITNKTRVLAFAAEGVDVVVSTDHDYVTDFAPYIREIGGQEVLASVIGEEISTTAYGHYNLFPLDRREGAINGGALDWAGGRGPTLNLPQMFAEARAMGARTIHFNHPRGFLGGLTSLRVDMDTFASHANPEDLQMARPADATDADTKIFSTDFNAIEILNSGEDDFQWSHVYPKLNDWFTMLSRGLKVAATGVSDTHYAWKQGGGYWRTYVDMGAVDTPAQFDPYAMSTALNALKATATNGPFVRMTAARVDANGTLTSPEVSIGGTVSSSPGDVLVTLDVQVPEYLNITRIELYMHKPSDDARCPITPGSPVAQLTRVACDGVVNLNWPASSITAVRDVRMTAAQLEPVVTHQGITYKRYRVREAFRIPRPARDNWVVALVYGSKSLFPLTFKSPSATSAAKTVYPFALTNPIFIDADGGGYDRPPFNPSELPAPETARVAREELRLDRPPTEQELLEAFEVINGGH